MVRLNLPKERVFIGPALIWKRIAAFFIDIVILDIVVLYPFRNLFQKFIPKDYSISEAYKLISTSTNFTGFISSVSLIMSVLVILYFMMLEKRMGQSIGKALFKIYIASDNKDLKSWQLLVRNLAFIPVFPFVLLWVLDPLFMFFTKTNQRLCEILSRTKVVEKYDMEHAV